MGKRGNRSKARQKKHDQDQNTPPGQRACEDNEEPTNPSAGNEKTSGNTTLNSRVEISCEGRCKHQSAVNPVYFDEQRVDISCPNIEHLAAIWEYLSQAKQDKNSAQGEDNKIMEPTLIQRYAFSTILRQNSLIGIAPVGSGKTFAYATPAILDGALSSGSVLVLVPTRELVRQVSSVCKKVSKAIEQKVKSKDGVCLSRPRVVPIYGGADRKEQMSKLQRCDSETSIVVVGTPGRTNDIFSSSSSKPNWMLPFRWIALDEADQLAKEGDLGPQVDEIMRDTTGESTLIALISATYPQKVQERFSRWVGTDYVHIKLGGLQPNCPSKAKTQAAARDSSENEQAPASERVLTRIPENIEQIVHVCAEHKKPKKLVTVLRAIQKVHKHNRNRPLGIVFFARIEKLKYVSKLLLKDGIKHIEIHGQLQNQVREANLDMFSTGKIPLILATNLAARGIHVDNVKFVIQYDFPGNLEEYVHRSGRAGRSGRSAKVYSFFTRNLQPMAGDLIKLLEANNAWVDPNLRVLVSGPGESKNNRGQKRLAENVESKPPPKKKTQPPTQRKQNRNNTNASDDDDDEDGEFAHLAPNRIVLKRASHVSDASDSSDSDE